MDDAADGLTLTFSSGRRCDHREHPTHTFVSTRDSLAAGGRRSDPRKSSYGILDVGVPNQVHARRKAGPSATTGSHNAKGPGRWSGPVMFTLVFISPCRSRRALREGRIPPFSLDSWMTQ